ncbi:MAG: hypothetical protein IIC56_10640 [Proteobacteria bacterium]|nr:hypothetical protein [Pseudomonadota bacterium]
MALTPRLELRQSQTLVMTPQLQQAIKLLQLSNLELSEYVEEELEKNPMLERDEGEGDDGDDGDERRDWSQESNSPIADTGTEDPDGADREPESLQSIEIADDARDVDYDNAYSETAPPTGAMGTSRRPRSPTPASAAAVSMQWRRISRKRFPKNRRCAIT